jgi:glycosyltransferase involved in cell wall biosynthesis
MKLSIITVSLDSRQYIEKTIESVLGQTHKDLEYVIVDGGSTDGTVDIIKRYAALDNRIIWQSQADSGIADAMNRGVALATGEIIAHLNSDDYYADSDVIARIAGIFSRNSSVGWLTGGLDFVSEDETFIRAIRVRRYSFRRLLRGNILLHPATFIRRTLFDSVGGFNMGLHYCMDYDIFLRLAARAAPVLLDEQLACFRVHSTSRSVSQSDLAYAEEFQVRMSWLRANGRSTACYRLDYLIKRIMNRYFYKLLLRSSRKER